MPATDRITPADVIAFTEGDCWALAQTLANLTGWEVYALGAFPAAARHHDLYGFDWVHVVVQTPTGRYLDVDGIADLDMLNDAYAWTIGRMYGWRADILELMPVRSAQDWADLLRGAPRKYPAADVEAVAAAVLDLYGTEATVPVQQSFGTGFTTTLADLLKI